MESILLYFEKSKQYNRLWFQSKFKEPIGTEEMEGRDYNFSCLVQFLREGGRKISPEPILATIIN